MVGQLAPHEGGRDTNEAGGVDERHDWAALYRSYHGLVHRHCRRFLATTVAADDATQEIFTKLIANAARIPSGEGTAPWMHRVAANHCLNQLRRERGLGTLAVLHELGALTQDEVATRDLALHLLAHVPEQLRLVAWLRHACDLELQEIATMLRVSRRTVVTRLGRFNARARRVLQLERHDAE